MQGAGEFGDVVDVGRLTGHMQVRRFVRPIHTDGGSLGLQRRRDDRGLGLLVHGVTPSRAQTVACAAGSGASVRVSSQKRRSRLPAAR